MKKQTYLFSLAIVCLGLSMASCKKTGCTDKKADNYSEKAKKDDGSCTYTVISAADSVRHFTLTMDLAYNDLQTDPRCFLDLDAGKAYKVSEGLAHQTEIDLVYVLRYFPANDPMFISMGDFDGSPGMTGAYWDKTTLGINLWTSFNHSLIGNGGSSQTATAFAGIVTNTQMHMWMESSNAIHEFSECDQTDIGNIYTFVTHQNKRGAFRVLECQNGSSGYVKIEIKVEK